MNPKELASLTEFQLLDVRLPDDFEASHLQGAVNNCVFEISFIDQLAQTAPNPSLTTVVYGANDESSEASIAAEKMKHAGYTDVQILEGGIQGALSLNIAAEAGTPLPDEPQAPEGQHSLELEESTFEWLGRNLINKHWGTAPIESGHLDFNKGAVVSGEFKIDLQGLVCTDLKDTDLHDVLIAHLQNDDFFDVTNHPKAIFTVTGSSPIEGGSPGAPNLTIFGDLTLRGQTHPIQFEAATGLTSEGHFAMQASLSIDRTRWGILYGSGKFFHRLAGHLVNDLLEFQLRIITK